MSTVTQMGSFLKPRLRLRGLPFDTTKEQLVQFFSSFKLLEDERLNPPVDLITHSDGRPTGQAMVYFGETTEALRAQRALHRTFLKNRWIEMYVDHREPPWVGSWRCFHQLTGVALTNWSPPSLESENPSASAASSSAGVCWWCPAHKRLRNKHLETSIG